MKLLPIVLLSLAASAQAVVFDASSAIPGATPGTWTITSGGLTVDVVTNDANSFNTTFATTGEIYPQADEFTIRDAAPTISVTPQFIGQATSVTYIDADSLTDTNFVVNGTVIPFTAVLIDNATAHDTPTVLPVTGSNITASLDGGLIGFTQFEFDQVPEPSSALLGGLLGAALLLRRKR